MLCRSINRTNALGVEARVDAPVGINGVCVLDGSRLAEILPLQQAMVLPDIGPCYSRSCIVDLPR